MSKTNFLYYKNDENINVYNLKTFKNLKKKGLISSGNFGTVYLVEDKNLNDYALKASIRFRHIITNKSDPFYLLNDKNVEDTPTDLNFVEIREISIPRQLNHPNLIKVLDSIANKTEVWILMKYYPKKLEDYIKEQKQITENLLKNITYQLLCGVNYLHDNFIIHRDLKLDNIFYDEQTKKVIIGDLGLSRKIDYEGEDTALTLVGTSHYQPPEVLLGFRYYFFSFDIWSLGCLISSIAIGKDLFYGSELKILKEMYHIFGKFSNANLPGVENMPYFKMIKDFPELKGRAIGIKNYLKSLAKCELSEEFYDLLEKMLTLDPCKRISAKEGLDHSWLTECK